MDITFSLQELGFSKNEAVIYTALLKIGLTNVGPVVSSTGLHRQLVYEALDRLESKGLASVVIKNNRKYFQAAPPTVLMKQQEEKTQLTQTLLPQLLSLSANALEHLNVRTLYGAQGFFENLKDVIRSASQSDRIVRIIGGAKDQQFYRILGNQYDDYLELLKKNEIQKQLIAPDNLSNEFQQKFAKEPGNTLKTMTQGLSSPTYTRITKDMISIEIYADEPVVIQIQSSAIAQGYLEHFELLWSRAVLFVPV